MPRSQCKICGCWENSLRGLANHFRTFHAPEDNDTDQIDRNNNVTDDNNMSLDNSLVVNDEDFSVGNEDSFNMDFDIDNVSEAANPTLYTTFGIAKIKNWTKKKTNLHCLSKVVYLTCTMKKFLEQRPSFLIFVWMHQLS